MPQNSKVGSVKLGGRKTAAAQEVIRRGATRALEATVAKGDTDAERKRRRQLLQQDIEAAGTAQQFKDFGRAKKRAVDVSKTREELETRRKPLRLRRRRASNRQSVSPELFALSAGQPKQLLG